MFLLLAVPIVLIIVLVSIGRVGRAFQQGLGRAHCERCDAPLRRRRRRYADTCSECGHTQSWAGRG